jgi:Fic family protein
MLFLSYLQLFEDGNKRTSRLIGNSILISHTLCPLSLRSVDEEKYKQALVLFYEQNNFSLFKETYLEQAKFAVDNYFLA